MHMMRILCTNQQIATCGLLESFHSLCCCMCSLHTEIEVAWAEMDQEDDNQQDTLCELGQRYISHAIELCSSSMFNRIWAGQDSGYDSGSPGHKVQLWVAPAQEASTEAVLSGSSYSWIPSHQMPDFVTAVQAAVDACCVPGITAQVSLQPSVAFKLPAHN